MRRSNNCKRLAKDAVKDTKALPVRSAGARKLSKLGSLVATFIVVIAAVVIPSVTMLQNVEAVANKKAAALSIGDSYVFGNAIAESGKTEKKSEKKTVKKTAKKSVKKTEKKAEEAVETADVEEETVEEYTEPATEVYVARSSGLLSTTVVDTDYIPAHIELSDYDRAKLERLVMGEAGVLGYNGAALVAQAIRDSMELSGTSSIDYIIYDYQYDGDTDVEPSQDVQDAVSYIFDSDGCAVQHRILYFYAVDMVSNAWHESQQFIVSYGNMRFFDMW